MTSRRAERIGVAIQRELSAALVRGELRDPRLAKVGGLTLTGVWVSGDLSIARVYVDVIAEAEAATALAALRAGAPALRRILARTLDLRKTPSLEFFRDDGVVRGARIEALLHELAAERSAVPAGEGPAPADDDASEPSPTPGAQAGGRPDERE